jgi:hypothetical protein
VADAAAVAADGGLTAVRACHEAVYDGCRAVVTPARLCVRVPKPLCCGIPADRQAEILDEVRVQHAGLFAGSADLRSLLAQESSQVAAIVSAGFAAVLGD